MERSMHGHPKHHISYTETANIDCYTVLPGEINQIHNLASILMVKKQLWLYMKQNKSSK